MQQWLLSIKYLSPFLPFQASFEPIHLNEGETRRIPAFSQQVRLRTVIGEEYLLMPLEKALEDALSEKDEKERAEALIDLAPKLSGDLLERVLEIARIIENELYRGELLANLALQLRGTQQEDVLNEAIKTFFAIQDEEEKVEALTRLVPHLPERFMAQLVNFVMTVQHESLRTRALVQIEPHLPQYLKDKFIGGTTLPKSVYLSSTYKDLREYRETVYDALRKAGYQVIAMENYVAIDKRPVDKCLQDLAKSDIYVGIFAHKYGYIPPSEHNNPEQLSITELEYRHAKKLGKPCLIFAVNDDEPWPQRFIDMEENRDRVQRLRAELFKESTVEFFSSPHELASLVLAAIVSLEISDGDFKSKKSRTQESVQSVNEMIERLQELSLSHKERFSIGKELAELGDPRPGVGVTKVGLPDIDWVEIPGGVVTLEVVPGKFDVKPFMIARYPVTNRQFEAFVEAEDGYRNPKWWQDIEQSQSLQPPKWGEANGPRERVSWYEAVAFCRWLTQKYWGQGFLVKGKEIRLPTEWERQQAATGGDPGNEYPWGREWDAARSNSTDSGLKRTSAVGLYPHGASKQGVLDMSGNVWEWCQDWYGEDYHRQSPEKNPQGPEGGAYRVVRGGGWGDGARYCRSAARSSRAPDYRSVGVGFRLARSVTLGH